MSQSSFILVLAIVMIPVIAIYVTFFSVGSGFGDKTNEDSQNRNGSGFEVVSIKMRNRVLADGFRIRNDSVPKNLHRP
jgi:hypothetical protein